MDGNSKLLSDVQVEVSGLVYPWSTVDTLKSVFLSDPTSKSRDKYVSIVESLFNHTYFQSNPFDLQLVFSLVVTHVLSAYPASKPSTFPAKRTPLLMRPPRIVKPVMTQLVRVAKTTASLPQRESARLLAAHLSDGHSGFDESLFDDLLEAQLSDQPWEFLDEWDAADVPLQSIAIEEPEDTIATRPSHPLPLEGAGCTVSGEPLVNVCHSSLATFRPVSYACADLLTQTQECVDSGSDSPSLASTDPSACSIASFLGAVQSGSKCVTERVNVLPFPESSGEGVYSRRTSFSLQSFSVLSLADPPGDDYVRAVSFDEPRDFSWWERDSLGDNQESFGYVFTGVACCTAESAATPSTGPCCTLSSTHVVSTAATPTQLEDACSKPPPPCWDSCDLDLDLMMDAGLDLDLALSADLHSIFSPVEPAQLTPVCRPTPKRPFAALGCYLKDLSSSKRRAVLSINKNK